MFSVRFTNVLGITNALDKELRSVVKQLADDVYTEVKKRTPVDTGTARAGWRKNVKGDNFTVSNDVPYIGVLDKGRHMTNRGLRGSKQAPKGIVGPSLESIKGKN